MATRALPTAEEIVAKLHARLPDLRERYGVKFLGVFGSYVRGDQRTGSDLDVLVELEDSRRHAFSEFVDLQEELACLLRLKVDLVSKGALKPRIGRRILEEVVDVSDAEAASAKLKGLNGGAKLARREREIGDYLEDILDAAVAVKEFLEGMDYESFAANKLTVYATLHGLLIVGEATSRIPPALRRRYRGVPWRQVVAFRNVVAHAYDAVQLPRVWEIVHESLPRLCEVVTEILRDIEEGEAKD